MMLLTPDQAWQVRGDTTEGHRLLPRLMADGNYALPEAVLSDPAHASKLPILEDVEIGTPGSYAANGVDLILNGKSYQLQAPFNTRALQVSGGGVIHRFELQPGDTWSGDAGLSPPRERTELSAVAKVAFDATIWLAYSMYVEQAPGAYDLVLGQWHHTPDAADIEAEPPFDITLNAGTLKVTSRSTTDNPTTTNPADVVRYTDGSFATGAWYDLVFRLKFNTTAGALSMWVNGEQKVDLASIPLGYNDAVGPWWKYGAYRHDDPGTVAVRFANMEWGTADLSDRIANPLAIPN